MYRTRPIAPRLAPVALCLAALAAGPLGQTAKIELTPSDVGSGAGSTFTTLPTDDPALFGLTGADVRRVDFDVDPFGTGLSSGTALTTEYAPIGVLMNGIAITHSLYGGPASPPLATKFNQGHVFTFTVPVQAAGVINTSPDHDRVELWSGPDGTGELLLQFDDQEGLPKNFNVDRFVGGRAGEGQSIGSMLVFNAAGDCELDELIFEVCGGSISKYGAGCPGDGGFVPDLSVTGCPEPGGTVAFRVSEGLGGSVALVFIAAGSANLPLGAGCTLLLNPVPVLTHFLTLPLTGAGPGAGLGSQQVVVPAGVGSSTLYFQAFCPDLAAQLGGSLTNGVRVDFP